VRKRSKIDFHGAVRVQLCDHDGRHRFLRLFAGAVACDKDGIASFSREERPGRSACRAPHWCGPSKATGLTNSSARATPADLAVREVTLDAQYGKRNAGDLGDAVELVLGKSPDSQSRHCR